VNRQSLNLHQCVVVSDKFMRRLEEGDDEARKRWSKVIQKRKATGEPYIMYRGNVNKQKPRAVQAQRSEGLYDQHLFGDHTPHRRVTQFCLLSFFTQPRKVRGVEGPQI
jgi:hypothetical protein